jgi:hypothetical protein
MAIQAASGRRFMPVWINGIKPECATLRIKENMVMVIRTKKRAVAATQNTLPERRSTKSTTPAQTRARSISTGNAGRGKKAEVRRE